MATEEYYRLAEDPFISRKSELTALKDKLASQLVSLIEEKEAFNLEIQKLSKTITQSKEEKILLIQSMTQSAYTHEEREPASHSFPLLPDNDEASEHLLEGMSPNNYKKQSRHHSSRDEDYVERRGRKPKTLRVNISLSDITLPPGAIESMNKIRERNKKSHKRHFIQQANITQSPWILSNTDSNGINSPAQTNSCPPKMTHGNNSDTQSPRNDLQKSVTPNFLFVLNSTDCILPIQANHSSYTLYAPKDINRDNNDSEEGPLPSSENQSPNSKINTLSVKNVEETDKTTETAK